MLAARVILSLLLLLPHAHAYGEEKVSTAPFPYTHQGPFVIIPASIVSSPVYQAGYIVGAVVCLPWSIAKDARNEGHVDQQRQASLVCGRGLGAALGWPVYAAAGLPFFLIKQLVWDGPRALIWLGRRRPPAESAAPPAP